MKSKGLNIFIIAALSISLLASSAPVYAATNSVSQIISQIQNSLQRSSCASGGDTAFSCNNLLSQRQTNFGGNIGAQGSDNKWGGSKATQILSQQQSSNQRSSCASGGDTAFSCNNLLSQRQTNFGGNIGAQGGDDRWSGYRDGYWSGGFIGQSQSSNQQSNCNSGGSTVGSCNNFNDQSQVNYGSNLFSQR
ncbi:hypothetical protein [Candidatus Nitrosocosmicus sp. SS]|uniref:hypothetical protein n=1 Tax=Candidatus Nitrosocosmicus agrestis TaxID=2563600 RepID=UPI00122E11BD|nr:hypothetical protein [Candidatus Nitrosocosmicus sp. SS]KAA2279347.1 hypothetical protein F1Z66_13600 [Candidatus Nitrosocosmicus sp. SS]KAF0867840.1 hypothetical protein E5N71_13140 [Candidatus Nitrosocosmicus sp. SS]